MSQKMSSKYKRNFVLIKTNVHRKNKRVLHNQQQFNI